MNVKMTKYDNDTIEIPLASELRSKSDTNNFTIRDTIIKSLISDLLEKIPDATFNGEYTLQFNNTYKDVKPSMYEVYVQALNILKELFTLKGYYVTFTITKTNNDIIDIDVSITLDWKKPNADKILLTDQIKKIDPLTNHNTITKIKQLG